MALDAATLATIITVKYKAKMRAAFPDELKGGTVTQIPKEDGSVEYNLEEQRGPIEIDEEGFMPLAEAIAEAVVEHLKASGTIANITTGTSTGRIT